VSCFHQLLNTLPDLHGSSPILATPYLASIGPQTSATCQKLFGRVDIEAEDYTLDGLTQAIVKWVLNQHAYIRSDLA
jgi:uroporphyrinogen III methyltransferase/synthase